MTRCFFIFFVSFLLTTNLLYAQSAADDIVFMHHSCGADWLSRGLKTVLLNKDYVDKVNEVYYGTAMTADSGRPNSLGSVPGDNTNMNHWILWFNDYLEGIKKIQCTNGRNAIVMFKSCYPISNVSNDGSNPGDPFSSTQSLTNYKSVFRYYNKPDGVYTKSGYAYKPLERIFAENPNTLFVFVTAPPRNYAPSDATTNAEAHRARLFNNWVKEEWLSSYKTNNPGLNNVAVYDWFDALAYPDNHASHPNRLKKEYGGEQGDSHPNSVADQETAKLFSTVLDTVHTKWLTTAIQEWRRF